MQQACYIFTLAAEEMNPAFHLVIKLNDITIKKFFLIRLFKRTLNLGFFHRVSVQN